MNYLLFSGMRLAVSVVIISIYGLLQAQGSLNGKYTFRHITPEDGLLHSSVTDIRQDEKGYIWIMTFNGLQRYDGHRFVNYPQITEYPSKTDPMHGKLIMDTVNHAVLATYNDVIRKLDLRKNVITTLDPLELLDDIPVIFSTRDGLECKMHKYGYLAYISDSLVIQGPVLADRERDIWAARDTTSGDFFFPVYSDFGVASGSKIEFYSDSIVTHPFLKQLKEYTLGQWSWRGAVIDHQRNVWLYSWSDRIWRYDINDEILYHYSLNDLRKEFGLVDVDEPGFIVNQVFVDRQGNVWLTTDGSGLIHYNRPKDSFQYLSWDPRIASGFEYSIQVNVIYQDRDDNLWVGTDRGINIFNPYRNQIQIIRHQPGNPRSLPKMDITDVFETKDGEILVSTWDGGLTVFDRDWNFQRLVLFSEGELFDHPRQPNQLWYFVQHDNGIVWIGGQAGHIRQYDPRHQTYKLIRPPEFAKRTVTCMTQDLEGNVLFGLAGGKAAMWRKEEETFYAYDDAADSNFVGTDEINEVLVDNNNQPWFSVTFGLRRFDTTQRIYTGNYPIPLQGREPINTFGIEIYNDSLLLVGSVYGGIHLFNTGTQHYKPFLNDKLPASSTVNAIKKDTDGNIWFTTHHTLYKLNPDGELSSIQFNEAMITNAFSMSHFREFSDGRLVTATSSEIISFHPKDIDSQPADLVIQITGFHLRDRDLYIDTFLSQQRPVVLNYKENFFTIEFSEMTYNDLQAVNYYYRLIGVDDEWVRSASGSTVDYTDIRPGEYVFEVKAEQGSGFSQVTAMPVIITPPWWATWWFRAIYIIALVALITFLVRRRIQSIRKEEGLKSQIAEMKMMALRSQMNPHFIFNCLNTIDNMIQTDQKDKATTYLAKFAKLIRAILENSKNNVIPCWKDLETLELYLDMETLRWDRKISYSINVDPLIKNGDYKVPPMIIQPFVENAIHHGLLNKSGDDKRVDISVDLEKESLRYTIVDNGVGRVKAAEYKNLNKPSQASYGIQITKDRIEMFNQGQEKSVRITDLYNERNEAVGTKVEVWLTMQNS